jgi:hypothetical protein
MQAITYSRVGDYLIPDIVLNEPSRELTEPIGRYGRMRRDYLKTHRPIEYSCLLLSEKLFPHLRETERMAQERLDCIISDILIFQPPPDKAADGLAWATHMETIKRIAENMMLGIVVYA